MFEKFIEPISDISAVNIACIIMRKALFKPPLVAL